MAQPVAHSQASWVLLLWDGPGRGMCGACGDLSPSVGHLPARPGNCTGAYVPTEPGWGFQIRLEDWEA